MMPQLIFIFGLIVGALVGGAVVLMAWAEEDDSQNTKAERVRREIDDLTLAALKQRRQA